MNQPTDDGSPAPAITIPDSSNGALYFFLGAVGLIAIAAVVASFLGSPANTDAGASADAGAEPDPVVRGEAMRPLPPNANNQGPQGEVGDSPEDAADIRVETDEEGYDEIDFGLLAGFDVPDPFNDDIESAEKNTPIPQRIRDLDGTPVVFVGYAEPGGLDEYGRSTAFVIYRTINMCCYGVPPLPNEYVKARVAAEGVDIVNTIPMKFYGTLRVQPEYHRGVLIGVYRIVVDKVGLAINRQGPSLDD